MREIVVGFDESPSAAAALRWAAYQAELTGAVVRAVNVADWPLVSKVNRGPGGDEVLTDVNSAIHSSHRADIQRVFDQITQHPASWVLQFAHGHSGKVLVKESQHSDLVVVGTGEHAGLGRLLLGSVSHYCLTHASCPVVCVPASSPASEEPSSERSPVCAEATD